MLDYFFTYVFYVKIFNPPIDVSNSRSSGIILLLLFFVELDIILGLTDKTLERFAIISAMTGRRLTTQQTRVRDSLQSGYRPSEGHGIFERENFDSNEYRLVERVYFVCLVV